jgi:hypothetical protein
VRCSKAICWPEGYFGGFFYVPFGEKGLKMRDFLVRAKMYVVGVMCALAMLVCGVEVFAQTGPPDVEFTPIVNFGDLFTSITTTIGPLVAGALGLGLAIWGASYIFGVIRRMAR